jgi:hypothetical protein
LRSPAVQRCGRRFASAWAVRRLSLVARHTSTHILQREDHGLVTITQQHHRLSAAVANEDVVQTSSFQLHRQSFQNTHRSSSCLAIQLHFKPFLIHTLAPIMEYFADAVKSTLKGTLTIPEPIPPITSTKHGHGHHHHHTSTALPTVSPVPGSHHGHWHGGWHVSMTGIGVGRSTALEAANGAWRIRGSSNFDSFRWGLTCRASDVWGI